MAKEIISFEISAELNSRSMVSNANGEGGRSTEPSKPLQ
jgi:hypothetical protein